VEWPCDVLKNKHPLKICQVLLMRGGWQRGDKILAKVWRVKGSCLSGWTRRTPFLPGIKETGEGWEEGLNEIGQGRQVAQMFQWDR
jgi:hypothetical protein